MKRLSAERPEFAADCGAGNKKKNTVQRLLLSENFREWNETLNLGNPLAGLLLGALMNTATMDGFFVWARDGLRPSKLWPYLAARPQPGITCSSYPQVPK